MSVYPSENSDLIISNRDQGKNCLFCRIAHKEIPADVVAEFEYCYVIKDVFPVSKGHILIIPYEHTENWVYR